MAETKKYLLSTAAGKSHDLIEIGGREFRADPFFIHEAARFERGATYEEQLRALAEPLQARAVDGEPVEGEWLAKNVNRPFLRDLLHYLVNGEMRGDDPKV